MKMSDDDATKRSKLMDQINGVLANIDAADKRVRDAKANLGTAEAELRKQESEYFRLRAKLKDLLPDTRDDRQKESAHV